MCWSISCLTSCWVSFHGCTKHCFLWGFDLKAEQDKSKIMSYEIEYNERFPGIQDSASTFSPVGISCSGVTVVEHVWCCLYFQWRTLRYANGIFCWEFFRGCIAFTWSDKRSRWDSCPGEQSENNIDQVNQRRRKRMTYSNLKNNVDRMVVFPDDLEGDVHPKGSSIWNRPDGKEGETGGRCGKKIYMHHLFEVQTSFCKSLQFVIYMNDFNTRPVSSMYKMNSIGQCFQTLKVECTYNLVSLLSALWNLFPTLICAQCAGGQRTLAVRLGHLLERRVSKEGGWRSWRWEARMSFGEVVQAQDDHTEERESVSSPFESLALWLRRPMSTLPHSLLSPPFRQQWNYQRWQGWWGPSGQIQVESSWADKAFARIRFGESTSLGCRKDEQRG